MSYTIVVNKKEYEVPFKVYLAHCTNQFKFIQTDEVYNKFLYEYELPKEDVIPFMITYLDTIPDRFSRGLKNNNIAIKILNPARFSILYCAMVADWLSLLNKSDLFMDKNFYKNRIIEKYINYNKREYSEAYNSIQPLTMFYHSLIYELNMVGPYFKTKPNFINKTYKISKDRINQALKDQGSDVRLEDIKDDLEKHCIILSIDDYYIWSSKIVQDWFYNIGHPSIYLINFQKLTAMYL